MNIPEERTREVLGRHGLELAVSTTPASIPPTIDHHVVSSITPPDFRALSRESPGYDSGPDPALAVTRGST